MQTLQYYFIVEGIVEHVFFNKYTIENGVVKNRRGELIAYRKKGKYNTCSVRDDCGKKRIIQVGRAIASTVIGPPPTSEHTADHIDRNHANDINCNIRWASIPEQNTNRYIPETYKSSFIIVNGISERTSKEWLDHLKGKNNPFGRRYTESIINHYAREKQHGFSYKEYCDLPGEVWKDIVCSENVQGRWKISNMNRVKYVTKHAESILYGDRLCMRDGYPTIYFNGKNWLCHILVFMTFFPEEYANKKPDENILHEDDDRLDFRPHKLRIGTRSENRIDAFDNGKYGGTKNDRMKCASYINDVFEKEHESQSDAMRYLKMKGHPKAAISAICMALSGTRKTAYGRTWELVE